MTTELMRSRTCPVLALWRWSCRSTTVFFMENLPSILLVELLISSTLGNRMCISATDFDFHQGFFQLRCCKILHQTNLNIDFCIFYKIVCFSIIAYTGFLASFWIIDVDDLSQPKPPQKRRGTRWRGNRGLDCSLWECSTDILLKHGQYN